MEGSKGEEAFDALGLNPQLFINDILNMVDDIVDAAFDFYHQEAVKILGSGGVGCSMMSEDLARGISNLRFLVEAVLDKQMSIWEKYCLGHCFSVPETFVLPKNQFSSGNCSIHPELPDEQLDLQLDSLRMKLAAAGKKNAQLQRDTHLLEMQNRYGASVVETVQLLEQNSVPQIFKGMLGGWHVACYNTCHSSNGPENFFYAARRSPMYLITSIPSCLFVCATDIEEAASMLQKQIQETMAIIKDDAENQGLIKINMLKEGIRKEDKDLSTRLVEIQNVVKILRTM